MFRAGRSRGNGGRGPRGGAGFAPLGFSVMGSGLSVYGGGLRGAFSSDMVDVYAEVLVLSSWSVRGFWIRKEWKGLRVLRCWTQRRVELGMTKWVLAASDTCVYMAYLHVICVAYDGQTCYSLHGHVRSRLSQGLSPPNTQRRGRVLSVGSVQHVYRTVPRWIGGCVPPPVGTLMFEAASKPDKPDILSPSTLRSLGRASRHFHAGTSERASYRLHHGKAKLEGELARACLCKLSRVSPRTETVEYHKSLHICPEHAYPGPMNVPRSFLRAYRGVFARSSFPFRT